MTGDLFLSTPLPPARRRKPAKQTTVIITAEAIDSARRHGGDGEGVIVEAIRAARPEVRNVAVDLGSIRWTNPKTGKRLTFATPVSVRDALLELASGGMVQPFRFILERAAQAVRAT